MLQRTTIGVAQSTLIPGSSRAPGTGKTACTGLRCLQEARWGEAVTTHSCHSRTTPPSVPPRYPSSSWKNMQGWQKTDESTCCSLPCLGWAGWVQGPHGLTSKPTSRKHSRTEFLPPGSCSEVPAVELDLQVIGSLHTKEKNRVERQTRNSKSCHHLGTRSPCKTWSSIYQTTTKENLSGYSYLIRHSSISRTAEEDHKEHWQRYSQNVDHPKPWTLFSCLQHLPHYTWLKYKTTVIQRTGLWHQI